jgi:flavin reductase (DIM6/NTAB) family NADH-FMN oxidoreductase RutF
MDQTALYKLLIGCVVPRPIAWVSTADLAGVRNVAPLQLLHGHHRRPATLAFSSGPRRSANGRSAKDTVTNCKATGEFVVNVVDDDRAEQMNMTSGDYAPEVDEFTVAGLEGAPGVRVKAPRVADAPISMECRLTRIIPVGNGPHNLVLGEIVYFHVREDLYDAASGRIDLHRLRPVGRLAGNLYSRVPRHLRDEAPDGRLSRLTSRGPDAISGLVPASSPALVP